MVTIALSFWLSAGVAAWLAADVVAGLPDDAALRGIGTMSRSTTIYDWEDKAAFTIFKEQRIEVPLSKVSPHLVDAILAVEDQRFFDHGGVDIIRVAGAALSNVKDGWGAQGGSTITQQLARQSFFTPEKTIRRKLKEIVVATKLESAYSKEQILELYLNKVYFGDGLYGVEAASLGYFGKHASELDVAQAALLAGLVKAPSSYAPTVNMQRATARRNAALDAMRAAGFIDGPAHEAALARPVTLEDTLRGREGYGQYFKEEVRKQLVQQFGWERVYEGGLKVYTTVDLEVQKSAETEVQRTVTEIEARQGRNRATDAQLQAALVAIDPHTGEIRAMVGGRNFDDSRFNRVTQARRQSGSAFKTFVYAAAIERGYSPASLIEPLETPIMTLDGEWLPDDHSTEGTMTMRAALRDSSNRAAVSMLQGIGIPAALRAAERFGIESVPGVWSLALGSGEVTLLSMTAAYSSFANEGMRPEPLMIRRVETQEGDVLYTATPRAHRAVSEATAYLVSSMLSDVIDGGTGSQARRFGFRHPAAGKTGTTNDYRDAWFVGYTPHLATGVWVGYDMPRTIIGRGYAGTLAVPLWGRFMAAATKDHEPTRFKAPRTIVPATICRLSGKLATSACRGSVSYYDENDASAESMAYTEYFTRGTEPTDYCPWHRQYVPYTMAGSSLPGPSDTKPPQAAVTPVTTSGVVSTAVATPEPARTAQQEAQPQPEQKRRGFWGRLFGRGPRDTAKNDRQDR